MRVGASPPLMVFLSALVVILVGCAPDAGTDARPAAVPTPVVPARTTVSVPASVQEIPGQPPVTHYGTVADPEVGVAYEYHLYVHCGIRGARFGGRWWRPVSPTDGPPVRTTSNPAVGSIGSSNDVNYLLGSMTLVTPDRARLEWDGGSADFVPAEAGPPACA